MKGRWGIETAEWGGLGQQQEEEDGAGDQEER